MPAVSAVRGSLVGMATRTSPTRSSSSSATSRSGSAGRRGSGRKGSTATVPEADRPAAPLRALHTLWMGLATPVGAGFRKLGPDVRIDREERRDGTGLLLLLLAALIAAVEWWGLRGTAVGRVVHGVVGGTVGWFALLVPIALLVVAVRCFRHATDHRANGRIIIGLLMATVAGSGIAHLVGGVPSAADAFEDMLGAGGMVGYLATAPLASLLTPVPVWVLMILLAFFSVLVLTATPVGSIPQRIAGGYDWLTGQDPEGASEQRAARRDERRRAREERRSPKALRHKAIGPQMAPVHPSPDPGRVQRRADDRTPPVGIPTGTITRHRWWVRADWQSVCPAIRLLIPASWTVPARPAHLPPPTARTPRPRALPPRRPRPIQQSNPPEVRRTAWLPSPVPVRASIGWRCGPWRCRSSGSPSSWDWSSDTVRAPRSGSVAR